MIPNSAVQKIIGEMSKIQKELHTLIREKVENEEILHKSLIETSRNEEQKRKISPTKIKHMEELGDKYSMQISTICNV